MADEIREGFEGASVETVEGSGGVFEVTVEGTLVYSKKETGRFPDKGEVASLIQG